MAKISFYGGWIDLKSLNKEDKKNYKLSMLFFLLGAFCWGIHLSGTDIGLLASNNKNIKAHIKLKTVVAMIAENKSLVNMTYIEMIIRMVNSRYRNVIVIIFSPYYLDVLRMLGLGRV